MSYDTKIEYEILPNDSYQIIRNCPKCGCKTSFFNKNNFRVNANGNLIDVWLIYQCEKCKHTYNLSIYERVKPGSIGASEYQSFLSNDTRSAKKYGTDKSLFERNRAEINQEQISFTLTVISEDRQSAGNSIIIHNPSGLKVRTDKIISEITGLTRSQAGRILKEEGIGQSHIGKELILELKGFKARII